MMLRFFHLATLFLVWLALLPLCYALEDGDEYVFALDDNKCGGWSSECAMQEGMIAPGAAAGAQALSVWRDEAAHRDELRAPATFPNSAAVVRRIRQDRPLWGRAAMFSAEVFMPQEAEPYASVQLVAYHRVWGWFGAEPTRSLKPGAWSRVSWDLEAAGGEWRSMTDAIAWSDTIRNNLTFAGLRFFSPAQCAGTIRIANLSLQGLRNPALDMQAINVRAPQATIKRGECYEVTFDLTRAYANPFDPDCVSVDVDFFTLPATTSTVSRSDASDRSDQSDKPTALPGVESAVSSVTLPAFYFQDYTRRCLDDGTEACDARGMACWKARFTPRLAGLHSFRIRVQDREGTRYESPLHPFNVEDAPFRGFIRVDPKDPKYLSFDDGSLFYPLGMVIRSPWDSRCGYHYEFEPQPDLETYAYDTYFRRMKESGMNFARVWMASWWVALEWSRGYRHDYEGLGRYSLMNAWRLDHVIQQGEKMEIYFDLTLNNHGQFTLDCDPEWPDNPNGIEHGGNLRRPNEFWKDETARQYVRKRMRYVVARWGYSPSIAWFLLCNEVNLVYGYDSNAIRSWHEFVSSYLKSTDPYRHLCAAHVTNGGFDPNVGGQPMMDIKQSNGYSGDMVGAARSLWDQLSQYKLPAYINEFGYGWDSPDYMKYNLHGGLWASSVQPFCGPALYWYWLYVHGSDQYSQFSALAGFIQGEDYRGLGLKPTAGITVDHPEKQIEATGQQSNERAYLWIYDKTLYRQGLGGQAPIKEFPATAFHVDGLKPGKYRIEFWDPWKGGELYSARIEIDHAGGKMDLKTPPFSRDMACKIKRAADLPK